MQDDSANDQTNDNRMSGVDSLAGQPSGLSSGAISDPTNDASEEPVVADEQPFQATGTYGDDDSTSSDDASNDDSSNDSQQDEPTDDSGSSSDSGDLADIKAQALEQLSPLVHKLEQSPEEKYKTIMMLIQASDNQSLIREAYETAEKISDEKAKAEALLNIVNEINYFTQNK